MSEEGVKSARRVFEVLELFAARQQALSVVDAARALGYPQSSASALMRTMTELGYLNYDSGARVYQPTARLPLLVGWIGQRLFREGRVVEVMNAFSQATGETIILGAENGLQVRYIHVIEATGPLRLHSVAGSLRPYTRSAIGLALLSTHDDRQVGRIVRRLNAEEPDPARHVKLAELLPRLDEARRQGWTLSVGGIVKGGGALAMVLPERVNGAPLAVAIAGAEASVVAGHREWVAVMRQVVDRVFGDPT